MFSTIKRYLAQQARSPFGFFGKLVAPRVYNYENNAMENFGLKLMDPDEDEHILEIGFGNGRLISELMPQIDSGEVHGIDISDEMIEVAKARNDRWVNHGKLTFQKASIEEIPYATDTFDSVFTCNTIYFWPNPKQNLREVKRVLKSGGRFFCAFRPRNEMESFNSVVGENKDIFKNLYTTNETKQLFSSAGFRNPTVYTAQDNGESFCVAAAVQ